MEFHSVLMAEPSDARNELVDADLALAEHVLRQFGTARFETQQPTFARSLVVPTGSDG